MKKMLNFVSLLTICFAMVLTAGAQRVEQTFLGHPIFSLMHCDTEELKPSKPVCITREYFKDEFYVVLKEKPRDAAAAFAFAYQTPALQTAVNSGEVYDYHNENVRISSLPSIYVSEEIKNRASSVGFDKILHIKVRNSSQLDALIKQFRSDPGVESISYSSVVDTAEEKNDNKKGLIPAIFSGISSVLDAIANVFYNDPLFPRQYALPMIHAPEAHAMYGRGSPLSTLFIFDTGGTLSHPDLRGKYIGENNTSDASSGPRDRLGHGTHVGGIAAALTDNGEGVASICPECPLYNEKVLADNGGGFWEWAVDGTLHGISVCDELQKQNQLASCTFNYSIAGMGPIPTVDAAFKIAYEKDIVIVAASGNGGLRIGPNATPLYPAAAPGVIVASAADQKGKKAVFSNYGPDLISTFCPGVNIMSTVPTDGARDFSSPTGYREFSGTSMAAPCVAGGIALVRGNAARNGVRVSRELINGVAEGSVTSDPDLEPYAASGGIIDLVSLHEVPLTPPPPLTDFNVYGTNWGSTNVTFMSVNDSLGKKLNGFLVHYSERPFDENTWKRKDVKTIEYNVKKGEGEGVVLRLPGLEPEKHYHISAHGFDRAFNLTPMTDLAQTTTQKAKVLMKWTFTKADGSSDPQEFRVEDGPLGPLISIFVGPNPLLWHLSGVISNPLDFRWNWRNGNPKTLDYKTSIPSDAMVVSKIINCRDGLPWGAEIKMDYFQQFLTLVAQTRDYFEVHATVWDSSHRPLHSVMLLQNLAKQNSTVLRVSPLRIDLYPAQELWEKTKKTVDDNSLDEMKISLAFRFLSGTQGAAGGFGAAFGNLQIITNPDGAEQSCSLSN